MADKTVILFMNYYENVFGALQELLHIAIYDAFKDSIDDYWKALYDNAIQNSNNNNPDFFFINICDNENINPKNPSNRDIIYNNSLKWSSKKKASAFDVAEDMKHLAFVPYIRNIFYQHYRITNREEFKKKLIFCKERRNTKAHPSPLNIEKICSKSDFSEFLRNSRNLVSFCKTRNISKELKNAYNEFVATCNEYQKKAGYEPIDINDFSNKNDIGEDIIIECCKKYNICISEDKIFETSEEELISKINEYLNNRLEKNKINSVLKGIHNKTNDMLNNLAGSIKEMLESIPFDISQVSDASTNAIKQAINTLNSPTEAKEKVVEEMKTIYKLPALNHLGKYQHGFLTDNQQMELLLNYNIFADASAFLNKSSKEFITNILIPFRSKNVLKSPPLFLHRSARNEIYELANMDIDEKYGETDFISDEIEELEKNKKMAKNALSTIKILRNQGLLAIVGTPSYDIPSGDMLINLLSENTNKRFCVLTQDKTFADILAELNISTLCAIKVAGKKPLVWSSIAKNLRSDHNLYINNILDSAINKSTSVEEAEEKKTTDKMSVKNPAAKSVEKATQRILNKPVEKSKKKQSIKPSNAPKNTNRKNFNKNIPLLKQGDTAYTSKGEPIMLIGESGKGGEGTIFDTQNASVVAKIYHLNNRSQNNYDKLQYMIGKDIKLSNIAWPIDIIYDAKGNYVGFIMPKIPSYCKQLGESVLKINHTRVRNEILSNWQKIDLVKTAYETVNTFIYLHSKEIYMGDVNPANILVNPDKSDEIYFVDCDSYQIGEYLCPVGTPIFTSPNYYKKCNKKPVYAKQKRTMQDEQYAIASLIFHILMNGQAPFASKSTTKKDIVDDICNYRFSFKTKDNSGSEVPDGPYKMIWNNLEYDCKNMLSDVFEGRKLYSPKQWKNALGKYIYKIENNKANNEVFPKKYLDANGSFEDFECDCCHETSNMHKEMYNKITTQYKNPILLCNQCRSIMNNVLDKEIVTCSRCGKKYNPTFGEEWRNQKYSYNYVCKSCKNKR